MTNFSEKMYAALLTVTKRVAKNTVTDGGSYEDVADKIFLLSNTEVGLANENSVAEGSLYALFNTASERLAYPTAEAVSRSEYSDGNLAASKPWYWWLRTPNAGYSYYARGVNTVGTLNHNSAYDGDIGVRPACVVSSSILVSKTATSDMPKVCAVNASRVCVAIAIVASSVAPVIARTASIPAVFTITAIMP